MDQEDLKKIFVEEVEKYTSTENFFDKEKRTDSIFLARKLYYAMLHIMKTNSGLAYNKFEITDRLGMMRSWEYSKEHKEFRRKVNEMADIISKRIKSEQR